MYADSSANGHHVVAAAESGWIVCGAQFTGSGKAVLSPKCCLLPYVPDLGVITRRLVVNRLEEVNEPGLVRCTHTCRRPTCASKLTSVLSQCGGPVEPLCNSDAVHPGQ